MTGDGSREKKPVAYILLSIGFLLAIWQAASAAVNQEIIIPSPARTFHEVLLLFGSGDFWIDLAMTMVRGGTGFLISLTAGIVTGILSGAFPAFGYFFVPVLSIVRTVPVMSFILLALIWFSSDFVPVFTAILTAFPVVTVNVSEGFRNTDRNLVEMAKSYGMERRNLVIHVYLPSLLPYFLAGADAALGLTWKVVVMAEVLSQPVRALGTGLAEAKLQLDTAEVFAWTVAAVCLGAVSELFFRTISRKMRSARGRH